MAAAAAVSLVVPADAAWLPGVVVHCRFAGHPFLLRAWAAAFDLGVAADGVHYFDLAAFGPEVLFRAAGYDCLAAALQEPPVFAGLRPGASDAAGPTGRLAFEPLVVFRPGAAACVFYRLFPSCAG